MTSDRAVPVAEAVYVPDAYEAIGREIDAGKVLVERYEDKTAIQRQAITEMTVHTIYKRKLLDADTPKARFYETYFPEAWDFAVQNAAQANAYCAQWEKEHLK